MVTKSRRWMIIPIVLLALSLGSMAYGIIIGEHFTVLQKATLICMECIGLG